MSEHPRIVIDCPPNPSTGLRDLDVQAEGLTGADELTTILLLIVERITGVSADSYVHDLDARRSGLEPAGPTVEITDEMVMAYERGEAEAKEQQFLAVDEAIRAGLRAALEVAGITVVDGGGDRG